MKRCPACARVEPDDALAFCRIDGTALIKSSQAAKSESETSILPAATDANIQRATAPTSVLPQPTASASRTPNAGRSRKIVLALMLTGVVAGVLAVGSYFYSGRQVAAGSQSIAVLPFENHSGSPDSDYLSDGLADSLIYRL